MTDETPDAPDESPSDETVTEDAPESPSEDENEAEAETEESTSAEEAEEDAEPEEWKNLLGKYKGNKAAAGKAYWSAVNDNARLAKSEKASREELESLKKAKAEPEKPAETPQSLKAIDHQLTALEKEYNEALPKQEAELFQKYEEQKKAIAVLEYELKNADDIDKRGLESRIDAALVRKERTEDKIQAVRQRYTTIEREHAYHNDQRKHVEKQLEADAKAKQEQAENLKAFNEEFPQEIDGYIKQFCAEFKIPQAEVDDVWEIVYENLIGYAAKFRGSGEDADKDWKALVKSRVEKEAGRIERAGRNKFAQVSKETKKVLGNTAQPKPASKPEDKTRKFDDGLTPAMRLARQRLAAKGY